MLGSNSRSGYDGAGEVFGWNVLGNRFFLFDLSFGSGDGHGGLFAGGAVVDFNPALVKPELDFFVTGLVGRWFLKQVNLNFAATIKIANHNVAKLRKRTRANVAAKTVFIFVHQEEYVGSV